MSVTQKAEKIEDERKGASGVKDMKHRLSTLTRKVGKETKEKEGPDSGRQTPVEQPAQSATKLLPQDQLSAILIAGINKNLQDSQAQQTPVSLGVPSKLEKKKSENHLPILEVQETPEQNSKPKSSETKPSGGGSDVIVELIPMARTGSPRDPARAESLVGKSEREIILMEFLESEEAYIKKLKMIFDVFFFFAIFSPKFFLRFFFRKNLQCTLHTDFFLVLASSDGRISLRKKITGDT